MYNCKYDFHGIIQETNSNYHDCTDRKAFELSGMIRYDKLNDTFIFFGSNKTVIFNSKGGSIDPKALSLKDKLESGEINKFIAYMKPVMNSATDRNIVIWIIISSTLINFLHQKI